MKPAKVAREWNCVTQPKKTTSAQRQAIEGWGEWRRLAVNQFRRRALQPVDVAGQPSMAKQVRIGQDLHQSIVHLAIEGDRVVNLADLLLEQLEFVVLRACKLVLKQPPLSSQRRNLFIDLGYSGAKSLLLVSDGILIRRSSLIYRLKVGLGPCRLEGELRHLPSIDDCFIPMLGIA